MECLYHWFPVLSTHLVISASCPKLSFKIQYRFRNHFALYLTMECYICLILTLQNLINAGTFGENLTVHKASVAVSVGQSILLQTSFTLSHETLDYEFQWETGDYVIAKYTAYNSSFTPQGIPTWTNGRTIIYPKYKERVEIYPLNGSLLLKNVKLNDTGIYIFCVVNVEKNIRLWVHENSKTLGKCSKD
ncbi:carcinoembryonic antigen-related cell adhesion molecule 3-like isoform X1 [Pelobates cultripes]|uniref:Carcinoembryonic antigen-related cell adhesion molecule 3-like isoform X1 n=1 Tax=Pelobates cultripes TaxID=61616 RepID=A0AAD1T4M8_PELCU|nr:carcinoembryonic antigen-related cell adhesion molecule 3-like isoform X1 [Pelobates cultripes]